MDRKFYIEQEGYVLAELLFDYTTPLTGQARVQVNKIIEVAPGLKTTIPLYLKFFEVEHFEKLDTTKLVEDFDKWFAADKIDELDGIENLDFKYKTAHFRYKVSEEIPNSPNHQTEITEVINIECDFLTCVRYLELMSLKSMRARKVHVGCLETNVDFIKRNIKAGATFEHVGSL